MAHNVEKEIDGVIRTVTELDHTAQEIDDAVEVTKVHSNPQLLDNWYWGDPDSIIDQRGGYVTLPNKYADEDGNVSNSITTDGYYKIVSRFIGPNGSEYGRFVYSDGKTYNILMSDCVRGYTGTGYTIDGWRWDRADGLASVIIHDGYITFQRNGWLREYVEADRAAFDGKTMTASILTKEGELQTTTFVATAEDSYVNSEWWEFNHYFNGNAWSFGFCAFNADCNAIAAKLELGDHQTLARQDENGNWVLIDPPPNKALELVKCQRYYQLFSSSDTRPGNIADYRPTMRANPALGTININGQTMYFADANL